MALNILRSSRTLNKLYWFYFIWPFTTDFIPYQSTWPHIFVISFSPLPVYMATHSLWFHSVLYQPIWPHSRCDFIQPFTSLHGHTFLGCHSNLYQSTWPQSLWFHSDLYQFTRPHSRCDLYYELHITVNREK